MPIDPSRSFLKIRPATPGWRNGPLERAVIWTILALIICTGAACAGAPQPPQYPGSFVGAYDETTGPQGPAASGFSDSELIQLLLPDDIPPIYEPRFVAADDADLPGDELIIGLSINGDARAYPTGILFTRELVNDVVGGVPVLISWCPRCYAAMVHERRANGVVATFGNQGALYRGAMTWFDHETHSVWSQPLGKALAGARAGDTLSLLPSSITSWEEWRAHRPDTRVLTVAGPASAYSGRRPGEEHVVGVVVGSSAAAWPYSTIADGATIRATVGETTVVVWRNEQSGAVQAAIWNEPGAGDGADIPAILAYRSAWLKFYPGSVDDRPTTIR